MSSFNRTKLFLLVFLVLCFPLFSQAAWELPASNPVSDNDRFDFIYNDLGGSNDIYVFDHVFGLGDDLTVNNDNLFVDANISRVGIGTVSPRAPLDVNGSLRIAQVSTLPSCTSDLEGSILFYLVEDRLYICSNNVWGRIGYDGDLDTWLDSEDCNDSDPNINPGVAEICGDSTDDDCDGSLTVGCQICYYDNDGDTYGDVNNYVWIEPTDPCPTNYVSDSSDCDDNNPALNPDSEVCGDTISNDCDSLVNEGCVCTSSDWSTPTCPDMSGCTTGTTIYGSKLTNCSGSSARPYVNCDCICRLELYVSSSPPSCPSCLVTTTTYTTAKNTGVDCVDTNNVEAGLTVTCSSNCSTYCSSGSCCSSGTTYGLACYSGNVVYRDSCGNYSFFNNVRTYCNSCGCNSSTYTCRNVCCGDDSCNNGETCATCSADCGACDPCYACLHQPKDVTCAPGCTTISPSCNSGAWGTSCWGWGCVCM